MIKTLTIAILSHERPHSLYWMLTSLRKIVNIQNLEIFVCDNSVNKRKDILNLISKFPEIKFYQQPGCNQARNYLNAFCKSNSKYIAFFHDDDNFITSKEWIEESINLLNANKKDSLFYFDSISYSRSIPFFLHIPEKKIYKPYCNGAFPFKNIIFPAWVYPKNNYLKNQIETNIGKSKCGKYSDILFVENLLEKNNYNTKKLRGLYMHVQHEYSDSNKKDYSARFNLIIHTFAKNNFKFWPKLIFGFLLAFIKSIFYIIILKLK